MVRQLSQIVAEYPAASIRIKLSAGTCSLLNAQVACISYLRFSKTFCWRHHVLKHSSVPVTPFSPLETVKAVPSNKLHNSYGVSFIVQQGSAMGIVSDIEKTLQIPRLGTALLAILLGALRLLIPWLLTYLIAVGLIIWGIWEAVKASNTSKSSTQAKLLSIQPKYDAWNRS